MCARSVVALENFFPFPEEQGNAPDTGQGDNGVDYTADRGALSAKSPSHYVELEQADAAPVDGADDHKDQGQSVQHVLHSFIHLRS